MAQPVRVQRKNARKAPRHPSAMATMPAASGVNVMPPSVTGFVLSTGGNSDSSLPRKARTPLRIIWPTATVDRITVKAGAPRSGREATRSITMPIPIAPATARTKEGR